MASGSDFLGSFFLKLLAIYMFGRMGLIFEVRQFRKFSGRAV